MTIPGDRQEADSATELLGRALELPEAERSEFVRRACAGRPSLRARLERLLHDALAYDPVFDDGILAGALVRELAANDPGELGPGDLLGRYEIIDRIGSGGMGVVFRARDPRLDRPVALKVLSDSVHADEQRFTREARAASALNHPHIATVYELGEDRGRSYIAMELVDGPSLHARARERPIPLDEVIRIGVQVAEALAAAHARGIVHRDLKPGNVVLSPERGVKLVDFGLAKRAAEAAGNDVSGASLTSAGLVMGTVGYMSPEQAGGSQVDFRSDHFSLGTMLYELVSGRHPFRGANQVETLAAILRDAPPALREVAPHVPHWLERVIHRCLSKDPKARFASTAELARALQQRGAGAESARALAGRRECPECERAIGFQHRYCPYCGFAQVAWCAACGQRLEADASFCSSCGAEVGGQPEGSTTAPVPPAELSRGSRALSGERRLATVVACRLDGYARLVDDLPPERRRELLTWLESEGRAIAEEEGGRLLRFGAGELLMVYGLASAREDDASRAIRAAERLHGLVARRRGGLGSAGATGSSLSELRLCTGISSGMVISEPADRGELQVTGPAVQAAQRLALRAVAGELRIGAETRRLSEASGFRSAALEGARESGETSGLSAFAGRERELAALLDAAVAAARGEGRFVEVVGEAGSGKTRLLYELRRQADWSACRLIEGRCQSYGAAAPYLPLVEVVRGLIGLDHDASQEQQTAAVEKAVTGLSADLEPYVPLYLHLLSPSENDEGLPRYLDRKHLRSTLQAALVGLLTLAAAKRPMVILLEDWHWVDEASHEVVRQLAELTNSYALTIIVTRRPEAPFAWPPLAAPTTLSLSPIGLEGAERIARSILGDAPLDREVTVALHRRSGGNPFFLEELCRSLREERRLEESGGRVRLRGAIESLELPTTVHAVLRARLDRVTGMAREVLRRAAVVGREFGADVLAATLDDDVDLDAALEVLRARGLIRQLRIFPDREYTFQHILVQEAAYKSLLRHQRVSLHGQVGTAIERVHAGRLEEHLERLAHHFAQAEAWSKAVHYGRRAARRAGDLSHFGEAMSMIDRSLEWLERLPEADELRSERIGLLLDKERLCETLGWRDEQVRLIEELLGLLSPRGDSVELVDVLIRKGELEAQLGQHESGERVLLEARAMSNRLQDVLRERNALRGLAFLRWHQQRLDEVVELLGVAVELDRRLGDPRAEVQELANIGTTLRRLDRPYEALDVLHQAQELNRQVKDTLRETNIRYMLSWVYRLLGDDERARECLTPDRSPMGESAIERPYQLIALASLALEHGQVDESLEFLRQSVDSCRASRYRAGLAHSLRSLAETLIRLGRAEQALEAGLEGAALFAQLGEAASELRLRAMCAPLLESQGGSKVLAQWQRVVELSRNLGRTDLEIDGLLGCARSLSARGELEAAREPLECALVLARVGAADHEQSEPPPSGAGLGSPAPTRDAGSQLGEVLNNLGIIEWRLERYEQALERYEQALEHFRGRGDRRHEGLMLNSLGATLRKLDRPEEATAVLLRAESVHRESGEELLRGHASALLGDLERDAGRLEEAGRWYGQSLEIRRAIGDLGGEAWMLLRLAEVAAALGARDQAVESLSGAAALGRRLGDERIGAECSRLERTVGES